MKLQHDTHYITKSLDVRYITTDNVSKSHLLSKHSLYNPNNIDSTVAVSEYGSLYNFNPVDKDILLNSALCLQRDDEDFILLQNFEFVNYYGDKLISTVIKSSYDFTFLSDKDAKQGCIRVKGDNLNIHEFPILALITEDSCTIRDKLNNLYRCIR